MIKNNPNAVEHEGVRYFYSEATDSFIGPRHTIKSFHPLYCRLVAIRNGSYRVMPESASPLSLGAL